MVPRISVSQVVDAPPSAVWRELADVARHVDWMADAESIRFASDQRTGVGTRFDCVTRVGPLRTVDRMEVTDWREGHEIAVRHQGLVRGEGRFTIEAAKVEAERRTEGTVVGWTERIRFPWYLGGPVTGLLAAPVLRRIWRANLRRLAAQVERVPGGRPSTT
jgi:carbon monoxide dehydrogenase subunit G